MIKQLVTHDGKFHADELFSSIVLTGLYPDATLTRSREARDITPGENKIIYDVGGAYDPDHQIFDHHQVNAPVREDGAPYSSFGLVWEHFGRSWLKNVAGVGAQDVDAIHIAVGRSFVRDVDALDNGQNIPGAASPLNVTRLVESMAPDFDDDTPDGMDAAFHDALTTFRQLFSHHVRTVAAKVRSARIVSDILANHDGSPILELPYGMPWEGAVRKAGADHILLTVIPRQGDWTLSTVRVKPGSFDNRMDLPESWAGLTHEALAAVSGVEDATFAHRGRFFAVAKSREGVLKLAEIALRANPSLSQDNGEMSL